MRDRWEGSLTGPSNEGLGDSEWTAAIDIATRETVSEHIQDYYEYLRIAIAAIRALRTTEGQTNE